MELFFYKFLARFKIFFQSKKIINDFYKHEGNLNKKNIIDLYNFLFLEEKQKKDKDLVIELKNIGKTYENGFKAINDFNLKIKNNEFVSLLGPSGCGKTTILRMIAGLELITRGKFLMNDLDYTSSLPSDRKLAMVFQNYALYPYMTVRQNIAFGIKVATWKNNYSQQILSDLKSTLKPNYLKIKSLKIKINNLKKPNQEKIYDLKITLKQTLKSNKDQKNTLKKKIKILRTQEKKLIHENRQKILKITENMKKLKIESKKLLDVEKVKDLFNKYLISIIVWKKSIVKRVDNFSKTVGIFDYLDRKPGSLSGGQRQRIALARAISKETKLFLFDEPLSNLDAKLRTSMRSEIRDLHEKMKATSIFVTHDQIEAMTISDRIVVMDKGYIQQIGTPWQLFNESSNLFVADFIGSPRINFLIGFFKDGSNVIIGNDLKGNKAKIFFSKKSYEIQNNIEKQIKNNSRVILGIRPQDIITDPNLVKEAKKINVFSGFVKSIENIGHENIIELESKILGKNFKILSGKYFFVKKGETIKFLINPNSIQIFDYKTGISISSKINKETLNAINVENYSKIEKEKNDLVLECEKSKKSLIKKILSKKKKKDLQNIQNENISPLYSIRKEHFI